MSILRNRSLAALIVAEVVSSLGSSDHLPRPAMVRAASPPVPQRRWGSFLRSRWLAGRAARDPERSGRRQARRAPHDAALGSRSCAVDVLDPPPALGGGARFPLLLAIVFAIGCFLAPFFASQRVILPELVGEDETTVAQANAVIEGATTLTNLLGPVVAGLLIAAVGATSGLHRCRDLPPLLPDADALRPLTTAATADGRRARCLRGPPLPAPRPAALADRSRRRVPEHVRLHDVGSACRCLRSTTSGRAPGLRVRYSPPSAPARCSACSWRSS